MKCRRESRRASRPNLFLLVVGLTFIFTGSACGPEPAPTSTLAPTVIEPTATAQAVESTSTYTPTAEPIATATAMPTATPTSTSTASPTALPTATPTATSTLTPTSMPTEIPEPTSTSTATAVPAPTATPTPAPIATATLTPVPSAVGWRGEYYANPDLRGSPALVRQDPAIGFDWVFDAPAPGLPVDGFSVRWSSVVSFEDGLYDVHAIIDDGMRVYVDDQLLIDEWRDEARREVTASRHMSAGAHVLRVEFYDQQHHAVANLWWEKHRSFANWKAVYWTNRDLLGSPALIRDDANIDFNWDLASPADGIPNDRFSARWTRTSNLEEGLYRFIVNVDDGVRVWVDDRLIIDDWNNRPLRELTADVVIAGSGMHTFKVEYYENTVQARVHVGWFKAGDPSYPDWKGEYFSNAQLSGAPVLVRNDRGLVFDWEDRSPAPSVPADSFSVRWTRERQIEPGWYRFTFWTDDGVRFYVDDELVLNEWHQSWDEVYEIEVELSWKPKLVIEFYEGGGDARFHFSRERIR